MFFTTAVADFSGTLLADVLTAQYPNDAASEKQVKALFAAMAGMKPQDELEGMLCGLLIASLDQVKEQIDALAPQSDRPKEQVGTANGTARPAPTSDVLMAQRQTLQTEEQRLERLIQDASGGLPGAATGAVVVASNRIALHQTFIRPVAIGVRTVHIEPEKEEGGE